MVKRSWIGLDIQRRGWPGHRRAKRRRPSAGYARPSRTLRLERVAMDTKDLAAKGLKLRKELFGDAPARTARRWAARGSSRVRRQWPLAAHHHPVLRPSSSA